MRTTFELVHEAGSEALDLFRGGNGKESNLCEPFLLELPEADSSDYLEPIL
jgi:hypothetical protein